MPCCVPSDLQTHLVSHRSEASFSVLCTVVFWHALFLAVSNSVCLPITHCSSAKGFSRVAQRFAGFLVNRTHIGCCRVESSEVCIFGLSCVTQRQQGCTVVGAVVRRMQMSSIPSVRNGITCRKMDIYD